MLSPANIRVLRIILMLLSFAAIFYQVDVAEVRSGLKELWSHLATGNRFSIIYPVLLLMPLNWLLEVVKWKMLTTAFCPQSYLRCARGVLSGVAVSFFTPNRSGDFAGRILHLPPEHRVDGAAFSLAGSVSQMLVTLTAGSVSLLLVLKKIWQMNQYAETFLYIILPLSLVSFHILYFRYPLLGNFFSHLKTKLKWIDRLSAIRNISPRLLVKVYSLSLLRYIIFTMQFRLLLQVMSAAYSGWLPVVLIMVAFLMITVIPSFALGEIGVRGSVFIYLFTACGYAGSEALVVSLVLWLLNVALPAVAGAFTMLYIKAGKT